jgi:hypothetical protein
VKQQRPEAPLIYVGRVQGSTVRFLSSTIVPSARSESALEAPPIGWQLFILAVFRVIQKRSHRFLIHTILVYWWMF